MENKIKIEKELAFFKETEIALSGNDPEKIIAKIVELKNTGKPSILPLILKVVDSTKSDSVRKELFIFIAELKDQKSTPFIISYLEQNKTGKYFADIIAGCWQSSLDFSSNLNTFIHCFILGDYRVALESFTLIEEMLWKTSKKNIENCIQLLKEKKASINEEKEPLYLELIKLLEQGNTQNQDEYPDLYLQ